MRRFVALTALLIAAALFAGRQARRRPARHASERFQRGVALGLFASDPDWDYGGLLDEIGVLGATDVEVSLAWDQGPLDGTTIAPRRGLSPSTETLRRTLARAHAMGLRVLLFPTIHVTAKQAGDWRGRIAFDDDAARDAWWRSYRAFIGEMASRAEEAHVERLAIGSELVQLESDRDRWAALIAEVRRRYHGRLIYSANWDHFRQVPFWDLVDEVGVTGYFELTRAPAPELEELQAAWRARLPALAELAAQLHRGIVLTEVGYPSLRGANRQPWDDRLEGAVDLEEQRLCYVAFLSTAAAAPFVDGVYVWNWFGVGGPNDAGYTPRGKPAAEVLRGWLRASRGRPYMPGNMQ